LPIVLLESFLPRSSRPNVLLHAALDGWRRHMAEHGHESLSAALDLPQHLRAELEEIPGLSVLDSSSVPRHRAIWTACRC